MDAPLRIVRTKGSAGEAILERIVKLAPAEVVGLYLLGKGVADVSWIGYWSLVCLLLVLVLRIWGTKSQWVAVFISFLSFGIWILAIGDPILGFSLDQRIASLLVLVFTFIVPIFYKGD